MRNRHRLSAVVGGAWAGGGFAGPVQLSAVVEGLRVGRALAGPAQWSLCFLLAVAYTLGEHGPGRPWNARPADAVRDHGGGGPAMPTGPDAAGGGVVVDDPASGVGNRVIRPALCDRPGDDAVRDVFCGDAGPRIGGLSDLQRLLALQVDVVAQLAAATAPGKLPGYVLLGHSTALSGHLVSPINARAIVLGKDVIMAFQRGVQQVELTTRERSDGRRRFYLVTFAQACNARIGGCLPGDLYTPAIEVNWRQVGLRDDEDLKNTRLDCRQCHQRARQQPVLLMRELKGPWTHFFAPAADDDSGTPGVSGGELARDYLRAHGDEALAGLSVEAISNTLGIVLELFVERDQPLLFDAPAIFLERWSSGPGYPNQPQRSPTWDAAYAAFKRGEQLALPHFKMRPTDPEKQARLTEAYREYREGTRPAAELPDLADIFPDDPWQRAEIGLQTEPEATPAEALIQACGRCHNDVLDQTLSRAHFNIALDRLPRSERELASQRIARDPADPTVMPPPEARQLPPAVRAALIDYLRQDAYPSTDLELLHRAAELGMAGGECSERCQVL